jgi:hypothetical protein
VLPQQAVQYCQQPEAQAGSSGNEQQRPNTAGNARRSITYPTETRQQNIQQHQVEPHIRPPSIELPIFSGENAAIWIQECESVFTLAGITTENKVKWANAYVRGKAKTWLNSARPEIH